MSHLSFDGNPIYQIEQLQARIGELEAENARLNTEFHGYKRATDLAYMGSEAETCGQLAASQAREQQLRDAIRRLLDWPTHEQTRKEVAEVLISLQSDTSALEEYVKKAGEVMREQAATLCDKRSTYSSMASVESQEAKDCAFNIRALPGVTLTEISAPPAP